MTNRNRVLKALREAGKPLSARDIAAADKAKKLTVEKVEAAAEHLPVLQLPDGRYELAGL